MAATHAHSGGAAGDGLAAGALCLPALALPYAALAALPLPPELSGAASTAQAVGVLAAIIAVHEAGHFSAARLQGIHVSQVRRKSGSPSRFWLWGAYHASPRAAWRT